MCCGEGRGGGGSHEREPRDSFSKGEDSGEGTRECDHSRKPDSMGSKLGLCSKPAHVQSWRSLY